MDGRGRPLAAGDAVAISSYDKASLTRLRQEYKMKLKVAIGADHAGVELKEQIKPVLQELGHDVVDVGTQGTDSVHYPLFAGKVARLLASGQVDRGILICGTGIGMSVVANRFRGVRAALCQDLFTAILSRRHNDANCLALGGRVIGKGLAAEIVKTWLQEPFEGGRHSERLEQIRRLERQIIDEEEGV
jgi:ribose 5-phosphate isomerase B